MNGLEVLKEAKARTGIPIGLFAPVKAKECEIIEEELEVLDIIKKHASNDGWYNGWVIKFWEMNETELKKVNKILK